MAGQLRRVIELEVGGRLAGRGHRVVLPRPAEPLALVAPGRRAGPPRLGATDQDDVGVAGGDVTAGLRDECLWLVAADGGDGLVTGG